MIDYQAIKQAIEETRQEIADSQKRLETKLEQLAASVKQEIAEIRADAQVPTNQQ